MNIDLQDLQSKSRLREERRLWLILLLLSSNVKGLLNVRRLFALGSTLFSDNVGSCWRDILLPVTPSAPLSKVLDDSE